MIYNNIKLRIYEPVASYKATPPIFPVFKDDDDDTRFYGDYKQ